MGSFSQMHERGREQRRQVKERLSGFIKVGWFLGLHSLCLRVFWLYLFFHCEALEFPTQVHQKWGKSIWACLYLCVLAWGTDAALEWNSTVYKKPHLKVHKTKRIWLPYRLYCVVLLQSKIPYTSQNVLELVWPSKSQATEAHDWSNTIYFFCIDDWASAVKFHTWPLLGSEPQACNGNECLIVH